jgi:hypothetical protein
VSIVDSVYATMRTKAKGPGSERMDFVGSAAGA